MGNLQAYFQQKDFRILFVGLKHAGKTSICIRLSVGEFVEHITPTLHRPQDTVTFKNTTFSIWDLVDNEKRRPLWRHFYKNAQALVFVVDSTDSEKLDEASDVIKSLLAEQELSGTPFLILANKQDLPSAASVSNMSLKLELHEIVCRSWTIQGTSAVTGAGLDECLDWLDKILRSR